MPKGSQNGAQIHQKSMPKRRRKKHRKTHRKNIENDEKMEPKWIKQASAINEKPDRRICRKSRILLSTSGPLASQSRSLASPKSMENYSFYKHFVKLCFFVSTLRRRKNGKNDADVDEKTHVFEPKRHAKIIEKSSSRKQRKIIQTWS